MRAIFLIAWLTVARLCAATYYVDATGGSDAAAGTAEGTAWQTLSKAQATTGAGDTIYFKRGKTWNESYVFPADNQTLDAYGTGDLPIFDGQSVRRKVVDNTARTGTVTRYLHLRNGGGGAGGVWETAVGSNTIEYCRVENHADDACVAASGDAHMIVRYCTISGGTDEGITQHGTSSALVQHCTVIGNVEGLNNSGTAMELTVEDSYFEDNTTADLGALSATIATFKRCRFKARADGAASKLFTGGDSAVTFEYCSFDASRSSSATQPTINANCAITFQNCVFYGGATDHGAMTVSAAITATNCIAYNWTRFANILSGTFDVDHSILFSVPTDATSARTSNTNGSTADPLFVDASSGNFRLQAGSPAINAGTPLGLTLDLAGRAVGNPPEIGAYEYGVWGSVTAGNLSIGTLSIGP